MSDLDQLLEATGYKFDELSEDEQATALEMLEVSKNSTVTVEGIKRNIQAMKYAVEQKLATHDLTDDQDKFLKARLRNYMLLDVLIGNEKLVKENVDSQLKEALKKK